MKNKKRKIKTEHLKRYLSPKEQINQLKYIPRALKLVWEAASGWALSSTILLIIQGLLPAVSIFLTREMVNALVLVIDSNGDLDIFI